MPGLFIDVQVSAHAVDAALAKKLEEACPVDIFEATDTGVQIVQENLDECTLCDLCNQAAPPGAVRVIKLYER
jgi:NAD-dependent dihydropyrimidine dehydrogenase PreA subunit